MTGGLAARTAKLIAGAGLVAMVGIGWWWQSERPADGPIVVISIDTLRADRLPAYGYTLTQTPVLDRLASDGVLFEHAYSHAPLTLPAHTSILSGRLPFEHGVRDNIGFTVKPDEVLLAQLLRDHGYATAAFVSSYVLRHQVGLDRGFDVYDDALPKASPDRPLGMVQRPGRQTVDAAVAWRPWSDSVRLPVVSVVGRQCVRRCAGAWDVCMGLEWCALV